MASVTYTNASDSAASLTAIIDWAYSVAGTHTYSTLPTGGQATITVTVAAPSGAMVTATYAATVRPAVTATVTELTVPTAGASPQSIALGGDNGMWFTEFLGHKVGRVATTVGQAGTIAEYAVSGAAYGIASGMGAVEANTLWFTEAGTGVGSGTAIGSIGLDGTIFNETSTPTYDEPWAIAADSSGNMWFTEAEGSAIGEITGLNIKEFPLPMQNTGTYGITIVPTEPFGSRKTPRTRSAESPHKGPEPGEPTRPLAVSARFAPTPNRSEFRALSSTGEPKGVGAAKLHSHRSG